MRVLVYGAGVIGGQICHVLCSRGNDVTVIARGEWAKTLRYDGLRIRHYIQRKDTVDHPHVLESPDHTHYDAEFAVMQYRQMEDLDRAFIALRAKAPDFPMPNFDRLRAEMPQWEALGLIYGGTRDSRGRAQQRDPARRPHHPPAAGR